MKVVAAFFFSTLFNFAIGLLVARFLGPEQFGHFALTLAVGVVLQTALFDWIRLTAVRFYSEKARSARPELRATLDVTFALIAAALVVGAAVLMISGVRLPLSNALLALATAASIVNGLFDYSTALVRARFNDRLYARLIVVKNVLALLFTTGGAYVFRSADMALAGVCLSMGGSFLIARKSLSDRHASPRLAQRSLAKECLRYSLPIVAANVLYLGIPMINRAIIASRFGFAETGQFSLAFDIGTRIVAAIGSALDVLLFQIAVRADEMHGPDRAREQVAQNMTVVLLVLLPSCLGVWLVLPSLQGILAPPDFRGPFARYLALLLPGLFSYGLMAFAINPIFQIRKSTVPMIAAALVACATDGAVGFLLPRGDDASGLAIAQAAALVAALIALIVFSIGTRPKWPKARDLASIAVAAAAMGAVVAPLRAAPPGLIVLAVQIALGAAVYGAIVLALDAAGLRSLLQAFMRGRWPKSVGSGRRRSGEQGPPWPVEARRPLGPPSESSRPS